MEGQPDTWGANNSWTEALDDPGVMQTAILADLLQGVRWHRFEPKQDLISSENPSGPAHMRAAALEGGSEAWVYFPEQQEATINLAELEGVTGVHWFNPASGEIQEVGNFETGGSEQFMSPFEEDALLMFGPPIEENRAEENRRRVIVLAAGLLLVLVLVFLILRQIRSGIG